MPNDIQYKGVKDAKDNLKVEEFDPSNLENIDMAFYDFVNDNLRITRIY